MTYIKTVVDSRGVISSQENQEPLHVFEVQGTLSASMIYGQVSGAISSLNATNVVFSPVSSITSSDVQGAIVDVKTHSDSALATAITSSMQGFGLIPTGSSVVALWRFQGNLLDSSGNYIHLSTSNNNMLYEMGPKNRRAVIFQNLTILSASDARLAPSDANGSMGIECLVRINDFSSAQILGITTQFFTDPNYSLVCNSTGLYLACSLVNGGAGYTEFPLGYRLTQGDFHHIFINRKVASNYTTVEWYVDGNFVVSQSNFGIPSGYAGNTLTVMNAPGGNAIVSQPNAVGGIAIHNTPLSASVIAQRAKEVLPPGWV